MGAEAKHPVAFHLGEMKTSPKPDHRLAEAFFLAGFLLVAVNEVVLHQLKIDPPLTTNPEGGQLP
jgi:hypothetical protein